ncbi:hypothetical protein AB0758_46240 [Tolypothrix bouteillei VB521301_2]|uniref:hypothetical protein n=1 Tax=Tolypothrix bouteillei TaxID=1246981 RepID=UPI0038B5BEBD
MRVILWSNGYTPWNYAKFLDYCTNRLFLQRVGGGYRFYVRPDYANTSLPIHMVKPKKRSLLSD